MTYYMGLNKIMLFKMEHKFCLENPANYFTELTAPSWLTSENTIPGSTMDNRWFWKYHVLTLSIGDKVETDFQVKPELNR